MDISHLHLRASPLTCMYMYIRLNAQSLITSSRLYTISLDEPRSWASRISISRVVVLHAPVGSPSEGGSSGFPLIHVYLQSTGARLSRTIKAVFRWVRSENRVGSPLFPLVCRPSSFHSRARAIRLIVLTLWTSISSSPSAARSPTDSPIARDRGWACKSLELSLTAGNAFEDPVLRFVQSHGPSCASRIVAASVLPITLRWFSRSVTAVGSRCLASHRSKMCSVGLALVAK